MSPLAHALLLLCLAGTLTAQARRTCIGRATGLDGKPMTGGTVHCVWASPGDATFAGDRQTATIDDRGRFRISLWPGVTYATWIMGPVAPDGSRAVSAITRVATGGGYVELRAQERARSRSIAIAGLAAWGKHGAESIRLHLTGCDQTGVDIPLTRDRTTIALPVLPAGSISFVVLDGERSPLVCGLLPADRATPATVAPPQERVVHVRGGAAAHASITVVLRVPEPGGNGDLPRPAPRYLRRKAVPVDDNGTAKIVVPAQVADPLGHFRRSLFIEASAADMAPTAVVGAASWQEQLRHIRGVEPIELELAAGQEVRLPDLAGKRVLVVPDCAPFRTGDSIAMPRALRVPANATMRIHSACATLRVYDHAEIGQDRDRSPRLLAELRTHANGQQEWSPADTRLRVRVVDATGGPAVNAWVAVVPRDGRFPVSGICSWHRTDSGGSVTLQLPAGEYGAHATDGNAIGRQSLEVRDATNVSLRLVAMQSMRCRFTDAAGAAVAGVRIHTIGHGNRPIEADWFELQSFDVAQRIAVRRASHIRSDRDGQLVYRFTPAVGAGAMLIFERPDGTRTNTVRVRDTVDWLELR